MSPAASDAVAAARASYGRCSATPGVWHAFYQHFFKTCPEAQPMFQQTDFQEQTKRLRHAVGLLLSYPCDEGDHNILDRIAERHSRNEVNVHPSLYRFWIDALIETVARYDPDFTEEVGQAWRSAVEMGIEYMKERY